MANIGGVVGAEAGRRAGLKQNESNRNNKEVYTIRIISGTQNAIRICAIVLLVIGGIVAFLHFGTNITKELYSNQTERDAISIIAITSIVGGVLCEIWFRHLHAWKMTRTDTSLIVKTLFHTKEYSFQELRQQSLKEPVKQDVKGFYMKTATGKVLINTQQTYSGMLFATQLFQAAGINPPKIRDLTKKGNLRALGWLDLIVMGIVAVFMVSLVWAREQYEMTEKIVVSVIFAAIPLAGIPMIISSHRTE